MILPIGQNHIQTFAVEQDEFEAAFAVTGGIYFILRADDEVKIGHSRQPLTRLMNLQTGNAQRLKFLGLIAAPRLMEDAVHQSFTDCHIRGEWFSGRAYIAEWLGEKTGGRLICGSIWRFATRQFVRVPVRTLPRVMA